MLYGRSPSYKTMREKSTSIVYLHDFFGLILLFFFFCTTLALYSYSSKDPSWFVASEQNAENMVGFLGSYWSSTLLESLGATAFLLCILLLLLSINILRRQETLRLVSTLCNYTFLVLLSSASFSLLKENFSFHQQSFPMGGLVGKELASFLQQHLNRGGAFLLTALCFLFSLSLATQHSVREILLKTYTYSLKLALLFLSFSLYFMKKGKKSIYAIFKTSLCFMKRLKSSMEKIFKKKQVINFHEDTYPRELKAFLPPFISPLSSIRDYASTKKNLTIGEEKEDIEIIEKNNYDSHFFYPEEIERSQRGGESLRRIMEKIRDYDLPPVHLLDPLPAKENPHNKEELLANSQLLEEKIADFKIKGNVTAVKPGPIITMYEFRPGTGVKVSSVASLADDLALALSAESVRIEAPIPGRDIVGIEVPNRMRESVCLREIVDTQLFRSPGFSIPIVIGKDTMGEPMVTDLKKMPHLLVAGTTGSGKSVFINTIICSLLYRFPPHELKMILVDPKQLELNTYENIPHLLLPVVTEAKKASLALRWAVGEMEKRYQRIARSGMRDVDSYNKRLKEMGKEAFLESFRMRLEREEEEIDYIPKIVIIIDELADLMMNAKADVENNICRLAQKARAAGIHLILATQRPSVDVITGLIKANLPARISFRLSSKNDSRTIFDVMGAERLVGNGDMLFMTPGESRLLRMHGAYVNEQEMEKVSQFWRAQGKPEYCEEILFDPEEEKLSLSSEKGDDPLFSEALDLAIHTGYVSSSMLQRKFRIGYNRAACIVESMEAKGFVGPADGSKPRPVLINR